MTKQRTAVFFGGPFDGKAMELYNDKNPYILLPYRQVPEMAIPIKPAADLLGMTPDIEEQFLNRHAIARYEWTPVSGLPESRLDIFVYKGVDR
ncbi:MAG: hypothetical protein ACM3UO_00095 [Bacillota bacterium]